MLTIEEYAEVTGLNICTLEEQQRVYTKREIEVYCNTEYMHYVTACIVESRQTNSKD